MPASSPIEPSSLPAETAGGYEGCALREALARASADLTAAGIASARLFAEELVSRITDLPRLALALHGARPLSPDEARRMADGLGRLVRGEPLQYVVGRVAFRDLDLVCDARALVPRPETEILVETVLAHAPLWNRARPRIADIGTGSGCIVCSLCAARPEADYTAVDIDPAALSLARENARNLGFESKIRWECGNLVEIFPDDSLDAIVANLPYIPSGEWMRLPDSIRCYEPRRALAGGEDGLDLVRHLSRRAINVLIPGGVLALEIGDRQGRDGAALLEAEGYQGVRVLPDLTGRDRILMGEKPC